jgi:NAD(P)-dependent dehydrogenase (short-subunit alcohol dehydrogenase family)
MIGLSRSTPDAPGELGSARGVIAGLAVCGDRLSLLPLRSHGDGEVEVGLGVGALLAAPIANPESPEAARAGDRRAIGRESCIRAGGGRATAEDLDVTDFAATSRLVQSTFQGNARPDYFFNAKMASGAGLWPPPFVLGSCASKHAVVGRWTSLRIEAAAAGVRVRVLCPGAVRTPALTDEAMYGKVR